MDIKILFTIETKQNDVAWEIQHKLQNLRNKLEKYIKRQYSGTIDYELNANSELYNEAINLKKLYPNDIEMVAEFNAKYTKEEMDKAVAFIPAFKKLQLEEYGDDNLTHIEFCELCGKSRLNDKLIANPDGKTKRLHTEEQLIKCGEQIDEVYGISKYMFDNLSDDYLKKGFKPIYSKRGEEPFGYGFYGESKIELFNDNYEYSVCESCGQIGAREKIETVRYCEFYVLRKPDFEKYPVNFSKQFFYGTPIALISPELYKYIVSRFKKAEFIPVFMK